MRGPKLRLRLFACMICTLFCLTSVAQVQIKGTVYDRSVRFGLPGVSVVGTSGAGTATDSLGRYSIRLPITDSISFSYLGKTTHKLAVRSINPDQSFDMSIQIAIDSLPTVVVRQSNYHMDSLLNRNEYRKVFDFEPEYLTGRNSGFGMGVSLSALLSGKKIRQMETLKRRLEQEERDKYVNHRFTKGLVRRLTGLQTPALDTFMIQFRPSYETLLSFETDYEYYKYVKEMGTFFGGIWRREHPVTN